MKVKEWDITLMDFIMKFCDTYHPKLKIKFRAFDDEARDDVIKTLIITEDQYIPDELRAYEVDKIDATEGYLTIRLNGMMGDMVLNNIKRKNYIFEENESIYGG